jgi:hypothetical protein
MVAVRFVLVGAMIATDLLSDSAIDFVADGAENAGRRGELSVVLPYGCGLRIVGIFRRC